jgi:hypothetical protein
MMRASIARAAAGILFFAVGPGAALAQTCSAQGNTVQLSSDQLRKLVSQNMACVKVGGSYATGSQEWVPTIAAGSTSAVALKDYKKGTGAGAGTDPTVQVGTAAVTPSNGFSNGTIQYTYGTGPSFSFHVFADSSWIVLGNPQTGRSYSFCHFSGSGGSVDYLVNMQPGGGNPVACP